MSFSDLKGKVAVVTGSTSGIGLVRVSSSGSSLFFGLFDCVVVVVVVVVVDQAIARRLASEGCRVVVSSRKQAKVDKTVQELTEAGHEVIGQHSSGLFCVAFNNLAELQIDCAHSSGQVCHIGKREHRESLIAFAVEAFGKIDILVSNVGTNPYFGPMLGISEHQWDKIWDNNVKAAFFLLQAAYPHMPKQPSSSVLFVSSYAGFVPSRQCVVVYYSLFWFHLYSHHRMHNDHVVGG
jgi:dehydrogenase/reductase SDR family protein 4